MVMLQQQTLDKEEQRIAAMRARAEARTSRFLNARNRTMGVDKDFLDRQVAEKRMQKLIDKQADMDQAAYDQHILRILEQQEVDAVSSRKEQVVQLREEQRLHASLPKNSCDRLGAPVIPEECSRSSGQYFAGEDKGKEERARLQQAQMRQWTTQQIAEKAARANEEREDSSRFVQYVAAVDNMRAQMENENKRLSKEMKYYVKDQNLDKAALTRKEMNDKKMYNQQLDDMEINFKKSDPFLNEDTDFSKSATSSYRVRPDHFKGFSKEQTMHIFKRNEDDVSLKNRRKQEEAEIEQAWVNHQQSVLRMMEQSELNNKQHVEYVNQLQAQDLKIQRQELKEKQDFARKDKFGAVSSGFFDGFGTSCR